MSAKGKGLKSSSPSFAKGGGGHMFGKQSAGPQKPGVSGKSSSGSGGGAKFASGGKKHMFGKQGASPMPAGRSGK